MILDKVGRQGKGSVRHSGAPSWRTEKWDYLELLKWYLALCRDEMCSVLAHSLIFKYKLRVEAQHDASAAIIAV